MIQRVGGQHAARVRVFWVEAQGFPIGLGGFLVSPALPVSRGELAFRVANWRGASPSRVWASGECGARPTRRRASASPSSVRSARDSTQERTLAESGPCGVSSTAWFAAASASSVWPSWIRATARSRCARSGAPAAGVGAAECLLGTVLVQERGGQGAEQAGMLGGGAQGLPRRPLRFGGRSSALRRMARSSAVWAASVMTGTIPVGSGLSVAFSRSRQECPRLDPRPPGALATCSSMPREGAPGSINLVLVVGDLIAAAVTPAPRAGAG